MASKYNLIILKGGVLLPRGEIGTPDVAAACFTSRRSLPSGESLSSTVPSPSVTYHRERESERELSSHRPSCLGFQSRSSEVNLRLVGSYVFRNRRSPCIRRHLLLLARFSCHRVSFLISFSGGWAFSSPNVRDSLADDFYRLESRRNLAGALFQTPYYKDNPVVVLVLSFSTPMSHFPLWLMSCSFAFVPTG